MGTSFGGSLYCLCCCCLLESWCGPLFGGPPPDPAAMKREKVVDSAIDEMRCCVHGRIVSLFLLRVGSMRTGCQRRRSEGQREDRYRLSTANEGERWWNWLRGGFTVAVQGERLRREAATTSRWLRVGDGRWRWVRVAENEKDRGHCLRYEWQILGIWDLIFLWTFM